MGTSMVPKLCWLAALLTYWPLATGPRETRFGYSVVPIAESGDTLEVLQHSLATIGVHLSFLLPVQLPVIWIPFESRPLLTKSFINLLCWTLPKVLLLSVTQTYTVYPHSYSLQVHVFRIVFTQIKHSKTVDGEIRTPKCKSVFYYEYFNLNLLLW